MRSSTIIFWLLMTGCAAFFAYGLWRFFDLGAIRVTRVWYTPPWRRYTSEPVWSEGATQAAPKEEAVGQD